MSGFEDEQAQQPPQFEMHIKPGQEAGVYANLLSVWHSAYEFTLDFASTQPPQPRDPDDPDSPVIVPCRVVSRVKIPPTLIVNSPPRITTGRTCTR